MLPWSRVRGVRGPPPFSLHKDKVAVGDALLFVLHFMGKLMFSLGYSLELEGF